MRTAEGHVVMIGTDNMVMPVAPFGGYVGGNGSGFGGDFSSWIILFLIFAMFGNGWGNGFGGGNDAGALYPWMNQSNQMSDGFRDQMINSTINGIQSSITTGFGDVQNSLCNGFAGVNAAITNAQMGSLERSFAAQTANTAGLTNLSAQVAATGTANQAGLSDLKYTVATEGCADRNAISNGVRDIIASNTAGFQSIMDKLCALELDGVKSQLAQAQRENVGLQNQLNMATLRESQTAQNAFIAQGFADEVDQLYNRLNSCPVPSTPVYGRTPIFTCSGNGGYYGCGCGAVA